MTGANESEEAKVKCHEREGGAGGVSMFFSSICEALGRPPSPQNLQVKRARSLTTRWEGRKG